MGIFALLSRYPSSSETPGRIVEQRGNWGKRINDDVGGGGRDKRGGRKRAVFLPSSFLPDPSPPPSFLLSPQFPVHPTICPWISEEGYPSLSLHMQITVAQLLLQSPHHCSHFSGGKGPNPTKLIPRQQFRKVTFTAGDKVTEQILIPPPHPNHPPPPSPVQKTLLIHHLERRQFKN